MTEPTVLYHEEGLVGVLTLNRPGVLNAFNGDMVRELGRALDAARASNLRALVLTGAGRAFSSGHDLQQPPGNSDHPVGQVHEQLWSFQHLTTRILEHPAIVIAAINGPAVGMAAELCVTADLRLASDDAYLLFPEVKLALLETNGVTWLLPRAVGHARASDWLLTGRRVPAAELVTAGLVSRVVPGQGLLAAATELALEIAASAPRSIRLVKRLLQRGWAGDLQSSLMAEVDGVIDTMRGSDPAEGVRAFHEKRAPRFTGE